MEGMLRKATLPRIFPWHQVLDRSPQRGDGERLAAKRWMSQRDGAALSDSA